MVGLTPGRAGIVNIRTWRVVGTWSCAGCGGRTREVSIGANAIRAPCIEKATLKFTQGMRGKQPNSQAEIQGVESLPAAKHFGVCPTETSDSKWRRAEMS